MPLKDASFRKSPKIKLKPEQPPQYLFWVTSFGTGVLYFVYLSRDTLSLKDTSPTTALLHVCAELQVTAVLKSSYKNYFILHISAQGQIQ